MKKSVIFIFLVLAMLKNQAQDYLISFAGSGETTEVNTTKIDNLTSGASVSLNGGDILHLIPALGISTSDSDKGLLKLYPNPIEAQSICTFVAPKAGTAVIYIVDLSGKILCQVSTRLSSGTHSFRISGITQGLYFLRITGENYTYSTKLVSQSRLQSEARIEYVYSVKNSTENQPKSNSATIEMPYTDGNTLIYRGTSGEYSAIAGGPLKETGTTHWNANNVGATNETGFTALPGGKRESWGESYTQLGITSLFWSSSPAITGGYFWYLAINNFEERTYRNDDTPQNAFSCRCIHD